MSQNSRPKHLSRGLSNRHIQLIALGGAIGTGLFLGSAGVMRSAGPSMLLGYAIAGLIAFLIMRQLGEMIVHEPVAGSFSHFAHAYWSPFAGFLSGWNYWVLYVLVGMAELTAVGKYVQYWYPQIPVWATALGFFALINLINLWHVKAFGEAEFWFALIKVGAIIGMIVLGLYLLLSGSGGVDASVKNLWAHGGFFPNGISGLVLVMAVIMFSFGGLELVGITAAEAKNPSQVIPKAINQVVYRILLFYIVALGILLSLYPWDSLVETLSSGNDPYARSPFVQIFSLIGSDVAAHILNFVVLSAALSVYNSGVYCNSRMLYGLAEHGNAPKLFLRLSTAGVPVWGIAFSGAVTLLCIALNYIFPHGALIILMALVVASLILNWAMISYSHLLFRRSMQQQGVTTAFRAIGTPFGNYLCLAFVGFILVVLYLEPQTRLSVFALPAWIILIGLIFKIKKQIHAQP